MNQADLEALLGRSLSSTEETNLELYLDIAQQTLEEMLCMSLDVHANNATASERTYKTREGYNTVFTDIFTAVSSVTVDSEAVTEHTRAFWDNPNTSYYNSIVFDDVQDGEVKINAVWGFSELPSDLKRLLAQMFAVISKRRSTSRVKAKRVEDFSVTYGDGTDMEAFSQDNALTLRKYSMCLIGNIRHGDVCD